MKSVNEAVRPSIINSSKKSMQTTYINSRPSYLKRYLEPLCKGIELFQILSHAARHESEVERLCDISETKTNQSRIARMIAMTAFDQDLLAEVLYTG